MDEHRLRGLCVPMEHAVDTCSRPGGGCGRGTWICGGGGRDNRGGLWRLTQDLAERDSSNVRGRDRAQGRCGNGHEPGQDAPDGRTECRGLGRCAARPGADRDYRRVSREDRLQRRQAGRDPRGRHIRARRCERPLLGGARVAQGRIRGQPAPELEGLSGMWRSFPVGARCRAVPSTSWSWR